jgi:hypothetical protein
MTAIVSKQVDEVPIQQLQCNLSVASKSRRNTVHLSSASNKTGVLIFISRVMRRARYR